MTTRRAYGRVDIIYSRFVSTLVQRPGIFQLAADPPDEDTEASRNQFIFEPGPPRSSSSSCRATSRRACSRAVLEGKASEESSRMVAMKNATENAEELIEDLTSRYNKVRQSNITREMIEIASGAKRALTRTTQEAPHHGDRRTGRDRPVIQITGPSSTSSSRRPAAGHLQRRRDPARGPGPLDCEVQQHLGNNWVRAVAMTTTDGLARGVEVRRHRRADHRAGRRGRRSVACSTSSARRSTARARSTPEHPADPSQAAGLRRAVDRGRGLRDRASRSST
jgi:hypothetical protein